MDRFLKSLGRNIRIQRHMRDLTQEELGSAVGVHANHIGDIERGLRDIRVTTLRRIAEGLEVHPGDLLPPPR